MMWWEILILDHYAYYTVDTDIVMTRVLYVGGEKVKRTGGDARHETDRSKGRSVLCAPCNYPHLHSEKKRFYDPKVLFFIRQIKKPWDELKLHTKFETFCWADMVNNPPKPDLIAKKYYFFQLLIWAL